MITICSYFTLPFQSAEPPPLFYNASHPAHSSAPAEYTTLDVAWQRVMADDGANSVSPVSPALSQYPTHASHYRHPPGPVGINTGTRSITTTAMPARRPPPPLFGVDPPRPPRDGFE